MCSNVFELFPEMPRQLRQFLMFFFNFSRSTQFWETVYTKILALKKQNNLILMPQISGASFLNALTGGSTF